MDEFGSPIAGGIRAVRRNISSSMLVPRRQDETPQGDPVTSNLLTNQSLQLKTVSRQLEVISNTLTGVNGSLSGISENLALSDTIDRQREAAQRNRERILAEQGLREGKESALEKKIQTALVSPLRRVGAKAQNVLFNFQKFFLLLAGGWLTNVGIDLINALVTGNTEQLNKLKFKFVAGLVGIGAIITTFNVGLKGVFGALSNFVAFVSKVTLSGALPTVLRGFALFLKGIAIKAAGIGLGVGATAVAAGTAIGTTAGAGLTGFALKNRFDRQIKNLRLQFIRTQDLDNIGTKADDALTNLAKSDANKFGKFTGDPLPFNKEGFFQRQLTGFRRRFGRNMNQLRKGTRLLTGSKPFGFLPPAKITSEAGERFAKKGLKVALKKFASKGLGKLLKGSGPIGLLLQFVLNLSSGMGVGEAAVDLAKATALFSLGQFLIPIPFVGGMIGIYAGEFLLNKFGKLLKNLFGIKLPKALVGDLDPNPDDENNQLTIDDFELVPENEADLSGMITPLSKNNDKIASNLRENETPELITLPMGGGMGGSSVSNAPGKTPDAVPKIAFNTGNPHTLFAVSQTGVA